MSLYFKGKIKDPKVNVKTGTVMYEWELNASVDSIRFLELMIPHLLLKRAQGMALLKQLQFGTIDQREKTETLLKDLKTRFTNPDPIHLSWGYLAGFLDADGSFCIARYVPKSETGETRSYFFLLIRYAQKFKELLDIFFQFIASEIPMAAEHMRIDAEYGSGIPKLDGTEKAIYKLRLLRALHAPFLEKILPHLIIKKNQALIAQEFTSLTEKYGERAETLHKEMARFHNYVADQEATDAYEATMQEKNSPSKQWITRPPPCSFCGSTDAKWSGNRRITSKAEKEQHTLDPDAHVIKRSYCHACAKHSTLDKKQEKQTNRKQEFQPPNLRCNKCGHDSIGWDGAAHRRQTIVKCYPTYELYSRKITCKTPKCKGGARRKKGEARVRVLRDPATDKIYVLGTNNELDELSESERQQFSMCDRGVDCADCALPLDGKEKETKEKTMAALRARVIAKIETRTVTVTSLMKAINTSNGTAHKFIKASVPVPRSMYGKEDLIQKWLDNNKD
jgi:hypothetical protein